MHFLSLPRPLKISTEQYESIVKALKYKETNFQIRWKAVHNNGTDHFYYKLHLY